MDLSLFIHPGTTCNGFHYLYISFPKLFCLLGSPLSMMMILEILMIFHSFSRIKKLAINDKSNVVPILLNDLLDLNLKKNVVSKLKLILFLTKEKP